MAAIGVTLGSGGYAIKECRPAGRPIARPGGRNPCRRKSAGAPRVRGAMARGRSYSVVEAFWKRPACDFSALARVSNQSAISGKPSSRAAFAIPGYILVYS
jgi:hypothetical protein